MDPLTGLLGLTALSVGSLAFLHRQKQQREGFDPVPGESYNLSVAQSQTVYNPLSQQLNPFANGLVPQGASASTQTTARRNAQLAFGGMDAIYDENNSESLSAAIARYFTEPRTEPDSGLIPTIQFCKEQGKKSSPFDDARFAKSCGMCLTDGTDEEGNAFRGPRGLFIFEKEKETATKQKTESSLLYLKAKPSLATCSGAPDQPVFAITKDDYRRFSKRRECQTKKTVGDDCGVCYQTQTFGYVEPQTSLESLFFVLAGQGTFTLKIDGTMVGTEDTELSATTPLKVNVGTKEASPFEIKVKAKNGKAMIYGYLEAQMANKGIFRLQLRRIVQKDEETNAVPKSEPPSYLFSSVGIPSTKMVNASGKTVLRISGILPFSFPSPGEFATLDCPANPYQTKSASLAAISDDPCAQRGASGFSDECLIDRIYGAGCTNLGTLAQNPSQVNAYGTTIDAITQKLLQIKENDGVTEEASTQCSGSKPKTPCEAALKTPGGALTAECLAFLYNNLGAEDPRIGPTYSGNTLNANNPSQTPQLRYCLPTGTLSPIDANGRTNTAAVTELNSKATGGFDSKTGIKGVQAYLNSVFLTAVDSSRPVDNATRALALKQCFNEVAPPAPPTLANSQNVATDPILVVGNAAVQTAVPGQVELTAIRNSDDGSAYIPFGDMDFYFMGQNYRGSSTLYWNANGALGFGSLPNFVSSRNWPANTGRAILLGLRDGRTNTFFYSPTTSVSVGTATYSIKSFFLKAQNWWSDGIANRIHFQIRLVRGPVKQYVELRCAVSPPTGGTWNISNGTTFLNTFGGLTNVTPGQSYVLESDSTGSSWQFYPNYSLSI